MKLLRMFSLFLRNLLPFETLVLSLDEPLEYAAGQVVEHRGLPHRVTRVERVGARFNVYARVWR